MTVLKESPVGKALAKALDSTSRTVIPLSEMAAMASSIKSIAGNDLPVLFAGESGQKSVEDSGAANVIVGLVQQQRVKKVAGKEDESETVYRCALIAPMFSMDDILSEADGGRDWIVKLIEKESAHVCFRPIRNAEEGEALEPYAKRVPASVKTLIEAASRERIDTEALAFLWPMFRFGLKAHGQEGVLAFLPSDKAIANVAKALRSKEWAQRNTPEIESRGLWVHFGNGLMEMARVPVDDKTVEGGKRTIDASVIGTWLESRDTTIIDPVVQRVERDEGSLDAFLSAMKGE